LCFEVGPGIGTLTVAMLPRAGAVCAVEADRQLEPVLAETCAQDSERLNLVMGDALRVIPDGLPLEPGKFVSNLPYQVAATLILKVLSEMPSVHACRGDGPGRGRGPHLCRSLGPRPTAPTRQSSSFSAVLQAASRLALATFMPPPHVDSAVVRIDRSPLVDPMAGAPCMPEKISRLESVIDAAFSQRRKTLRNAMGKSGFAKETLASAFEASGIDPAVRAETLSVERFCALEEALEAAGAFSEEPHGAR
jgi:16S rRNA (adenine1518-N6/adenine1519-N6)-dimethyltransferase